MLMESSTCWLVGQFIMNDVSGSLLAFDTPLYGPEGKVPACLSEELMQ